MKKIVSLTLASALLIGGAFAINSSKEEAKASSDFEDTLTFQSIYEQLTGPISDDSKEAEAGVKYDIGDGSHGKVAFFKGDSANLPNIRFKHNQYVLRLKYYSNYNTPVVGALGNYAQFDAKDGFLINELSWASNYYTSNVGYEVHVYDSSSSSYVYYTHDYISTSAGPTITLDIPTTSVRLYHRFGPNETKDRNFLGIEKEMKVGFALAGASYTLSFDTNGGSEINPVKYAEDVPTVAPTAPTRVNEGTTKFTFAGWYTDKACTAGNEFSFGGYLSEDTTIYAKWNEETISGYTLTFVTNTSTVIAPETVEIGEKFEKPADPLKDSDAKYDYTFDKWYADEKLKTEFDFDTVYSEDMTCYAGYSYKQGTIEGASEVGMKSKIGTYAADWSSSTYEEHVLPSSEVSAWMVDSTFEFKAAYDGIYGIKRSGSWDVRMKRCLVVWSLNDYSKYIKTVRWDLKNTGYSYNSSNIVRLYANASGTGVEVDSDHLSLASGQNDRCIQMLNNSDETITAVSFKNDNVSFDYGFEKLHYILGDASAAQQAKNFAKDFLNEMTCDGINQITAKEGTWTKIAARVEKMSSEAKAILAGASSSDEDVKAALTRYDFIINKYGTDQYEDFLNRYEGSISPSLPMTMNIERSETSTIFIVVIAIASVTGLGILLALKRRKQLQ